jgi:hypothetical protein
MQIVENEVLTGKTFAIDEKHFVNCTYQNCDLVYGGGDWGCVNTKFENCRFSFSGPAQKTTNLLAMLGILPPGGNLPPTGGKNGPTKLQ